MFRSFSRSQIDRLGKRLRDSGRPSEEDLLLLERVRSDCEQAMNTVSDAMFALLPFPISSRVKRIPSIIQKLRREAIKLGSMQDIAGVRVVCGPRRSEQDQIAAKIQGALLVRRLVDRRLPGKDSHSYRAVHLITEVGGCLVEVQIRTELQDLWAQTEETLAYAWGIQIKYGEPPTEGEADIDGLHRRETVDLLRKQADLIAEFEPLIDEIERLVELDEPARDKTALADMRSRAANLGGSLRDSLGKLRGLV